MLHTVVMGARAVLLALAVVAVAAVGSPGSSAAEPVAGRPAAGVTPAVGRAFLPVVARDLYPTVTSHVVQPGDNLYALARRYRTTSRAIAALNGLPHRNAISPGQEILVLDYWPALSVPPAPASAAVVSIGPAAPVVAFSFDAGSDLGYTQLILDVLRANGITVSFGMTGRWAEQNPSMLQRIVDDGHHLINHSHSHPDFTTLSPGERAAQLSLAEAAVVDVTGLGMQPYFRPPFGAHDASVNVDLATNGYYYDVMWTVDSLGWNGLSAAQITERCLSRAVPGAIYLFHVGIQSQDGPALQAMIDGLRAKGYTIGSVADLLGH